MLAPRRRDRCRHRLRRHPRQRRQCLPHQVPEPWRLRWPRRLPDLGRRRQGCGRRQWQGQGWRQEECSPLRGLGRSRACVWSRGFLGQWDVRSRAVKGSSTDTWGLGGCRVNQCGLVRRARLGLTATTQMSYLNNDTQCHDTPQTCLCNAHLARRRMSQEHTMSDRNPTSCIAESENSNRVGKT